MRKVTFYIDDLAYFRRTLEKEANITPEQIDGILSNLNGFSVIYTLYGEGKHIDRYALTDVDGNKININDLNGYQRGVILNDCMAYFEGRKNHDGKDEPSGVVKIAENGKVKYDVYGIAYAIGIEDVVEQFDEEEYALASDYNAACEDRIAEIEEALPASLVVEIDESEENQEDAIADAITKITGWLCESFMYRPHIC